MYTANWGPELGERSVPPRFTIAGLLLVILKS